MNRCHLYVLFDEVPILIFSNESLVQDLPVACAYYIEQSLSEIFDLLSFVFEVLGILKVEADSSH